MLDETGTQHPRQHRRPPPSPAVKPERTQNWAAWPGEQGMAAEVVSDLARVVQPWGDSGAMPEGSAACQQVGTGGGGRLPVVRLLTTFFRACHWHSAWGCQRASVCLPKYVLAASKAGVLSTGSSSTPHRRWFASGDRRVPTASGACSGPGVWGRLWARS